MLNVRRPDKDRKKISPWKRYKLERQQEEATMNRDIYRAFGSVVSTLFLFGGVLAIMGASVA